MPLYMQLAEALREEITSGRLPPGSPIPAEVKLAEGHRMGRETVRKALALLRAEGVIHTKRSEGTYVRPPKERQTLEIDASVTVTARMPTLMERHDLDIDEGIPLLVVERAGAAPQLIPADEVKITGPLPPTD